MSDQVQIGNTLVRDEITYVGSPFASKNVNKQVLSALFPEAEVTVKDQKGEEGATAAFKGAPSIDGQLLLCRVDDDTVTLDLLLAPQGLDDLEKNIDRGLAEHDRILKALTVAYALARAPKLEARYWQAASHGVRCVEWLKEQSSLGAVKTPLEKLLPQGTTFDWRPVGAKLAVHLCPPGSEKLPPELKKKVERIVGFEVGVASADDWENGLCQVSGKLQDAEPHLLIEFLRVICTM